MSIKNFSDTIRNKTHDLLACSAVPQPTAPPCTPFIEGIKQNDKITSCDTQTDSENIYQSLQPWIFPLHSIQTKTEPESACCFMDVIPCMETKI